MDSIDGTDAVNIRSVTDKNAIEAGGRQKEEHQIMITTYDSRKSPAIIDSTDAPPVFLKTSPRITQSFSLRGGKGNSTRSRKGVKISKSTIESNEKSSSQKREKSLHDSKSPQRKKDIKDPYK